MLVFSLGMAKGRLMNAKFLIYSQRKKFQEVSSRDRDGHETGTPLPTRWLSNFSSKSWRTGIANYFVWKRR